jgi:hypothetical protein
VMGQGGGRTCVTRRPSETTLLSFFVGPQYLRKQIAPLDKKFPVAGPYLSLRLASNILAEMLMQFSSPPHLTPYIRSEIQRLWLILTTQIANVRS